MSEGEMYELLEKVVDRCNECKFAACENCWINWKQVQAIQGLLDLYTKEKEKSKEKTELTMKIIGANYISKDKIKAKIEELENEKEKYFEKQVIQHEIDVLQSLLEKE